jgi:ABC-type nickel/cobalt efflux system permease component RcnA
MVAAALAGSAFWGAGHALTPGHGKAIVAAYLVGARSTPWHAVYLGLTVTTTHTLTIFALGLVTLFGSRYVMTEQLYPWLSLVSGLVIVWIGVVMAVSRIRGLTRCSVHHHDHSHLGHSHHDHPRSAHRHGDGEDHHHHDHSPGHEDGHGHPHGFGAHDHDHSHHDHSHMPPGADGSPVTWRSLLALGISGGILPCPSALVLLLAAVSLGRTVFGMVLVAAFSAGLAGVLIAVGLLFVKGGRVIGQAPKLQGAVRWMPAASAVAILIIGAIISFEAVTRITM